MSNRMAEIDMIVDTRGNMVGITIREKPDFNLLLNVVIDPATALGFARNIRTRALIAANEHA